MSLSRFLKSAGVGIAVAVLVLVLGVAGQIAWVASGLPGVHRTTLAPTTTTTDDRSETISESYVDIRWVSFTPSLVLALAGLLVGFSWASRRNSARSLGAGSGEAS
jgi:hypothetical protein